MIFQLDHPDDIVGMDDLFDNISTNWDDVLPDTVPSLAQKRTMHRLGYSNWLVDSVSAAQANIYIDHGMQARSAAGKARKPLSVANAAL